MANYNVTSCEHQQNVPVTSVPETERIKIIQKAFYKEFQCQPEFYVRVPGRVNIIGEHIDYCGFPVLPMALEQDIILAARCSSVNKLYLRNVDSKYVNYDGDYEINEIIKDKQGRPFWYNYVLCGLKGASEICINKKMLKGLQVIVSGNIPPASGLSSSSALVSAAALMFLHAIDISLSKLELASLCARSERFIGTEGGGMDQAIAFLAKKGCAQYITWNPLTASPVFLPPDSGFVVAHSLAEANKAATNDFNHRVIECRLAAKILANKSGLSIDKICTLSDVQQLLKKTSEEMVYLVNDYLQLNVYTREEICRELNIKDDVLDKLHLTKNTSNIKEFKLKQRATHVYEEASRVNYFRELCNSIKHHNGDSALVNNGKLQNGHPFHSLEDIELLSKLGMWMRESHTSLEKMYECSHPALDRLVKLSDEFGVYARLTGAGWGGCIVALCHRSQIEDYIKMLKDKFYSNHPALQGRDISSLVFATLPNQGAEIYVAAEKLPPKQT